jgi:hypothetical protein
LFFDLSWWRNLDFDGVRRGVVSAADAVDAKIETLSENVLAQIVELRPRTAIRAFHRQAHLVESEGALGTRATESGYCNLQKAVG